MRLNGRLMDLARDGAAARIADLQAQIDELRAQFPDLDTPRRTRPVRRRGRRRASNRNRNARPAGNLRKPLRGEIKSFIESHANLGASSSEEARRLLALLANEGVASTVNSIAVALNRARGERQAQHDNA